MEYTQLGNSGIEVSKICLGTMTWGEQNTEKEAFAQLDFAIANGINFIDTAEIYPIPIKEVSYGQTEIILGKWLANQVRNKIILATKVAGRSDHLTWLRGGKAVLSKQNIVDALESSLRRLQTDYIDLYQLHWPDRKANFFGQLGFKPAQQEDPLILEETLVTLKHLIQEGKIRNYGLSNETPWGVMTYNRIADQLQMPRPVTIQNPYNLLNRSYEIGLAEISHREKIGLMAYSPLGFGMLTGKYQNDQKPEKGRLTLFHKTFQRYTGDLAKAAVNRYVQLAKKYEMSPAQMALAFINQQPFLTANIIGATSKEQLKENIDSVKIDLDSNLLKEIDLIHKEIPNPAP